MIAVCDFVHGLRKAKLINYFVQEEKSGRGGGGERRGHSGILGVTGGMKECKLWGPRKSHIGLKLDPPNSLVAQNVP